MVTDSNRDRARRWSTLTETSGYTEGPGTHPLVKDETDARLDLFPDQPADAQTVTVLQGARSVAASDAASSGVTRYVNSHSSWSQSPSH